MNSPALISPVQTAVDTLGAQINSINILCEVLDQKLSTVKATAMPIPDARDSIELPSCRCSLESQLCDLTDRLVNIHEYLFQLNELIRL